MEFKATGKQALKMEGICCGGCQKGQDKRGTSGSLQLTLLYRAVPGGGESLDTKHSGTPAIKAAERVICGCGTAVTLSGWSVV